MVWYRTSRVKDATSHLCTITSPITTHSQVHRIILVNIGSSLWTKDHPCEHTWHLTQGRWEGGDKKIARASVVVVIIIIIIIIIMIIIIIIALKGSIQDFLQSPHCAANRFQHVRSRGPGANVCKSHAAHRYKDSQSQRRTHLNVCLSPGDPCWGFNSY